MPHPYVGHRAREKVAAACDLVEVLNCRTRSAQNSQKHETGGLRGSAAMPGANAHFARSIFSAVIEVESLGSLRSSILDGSPRWESAQTA
jgi:hypothetical protein